MTEIAISAKWVSYIWPKQLYIFTFKNYRYLISNETMAKKFSNYADRYLHESIYNSGKEVSRSSDSLLRKQNFLL